MTTVHIDSNSVTADGLVKVAARRFGPDIHLSTDDTVVVHDVADNLTKNAVIRDFDDKNGKVLLELNW